MAVGIYNRADLDLSQRILHNLRHRARVIDRGHGEYRTRCLHPERHKNGDIHPSFDFNIGKGGICRVCGFKASLSELAKILGIETAKGSVLRRFNTEKDAIEALMKERKLRAETLSHFNIKADIEKQAWVYPLPSGHLRYKAFDSSSPRKYWHQPGTPNQLYGFNDIPRGAEEVFIANGEPAVWVCWQAGIPAVCGIYGEGHLPQDTANKLISKGFKKINIVPDLDAAGQNAALSLLNDLKSRDVSGHLEIKIVKLLDELGSSADLVNLYLWHQGDDEAFRQALKDLTRLECNQEETKGKAICHSGSKDESATKQKLLARLSNLIDLVDNDSTVKYLMLTDADKLEAKARVEADGNHYVPPSREHLPFTLPKAQQILKHYIDDGDRQLFIDLISYFYKVAQLPSELHYKLIAWWVMHTYLYERFNYSPIIALVGIPERGKTRLGRSMVAVSYRGLETETLREANLFRWSQNLGATIFLDVKDIWRKAEKEKSEDILLKRYEQGAKVGRVLYPEKGPFKDTVYFDIYGPTIIATNEPIHHILDTRCLPIIMPDAGQKVWPDLDFKESLTLKERLVAFRARHLKGDLPHYPKPAMGRLGDILQPLGVMMRLVSPEEENNFQELVRMLWLERLEEKAESKEARLIMAVDKCASESEVVTVSDISATYNEGLEPKQQLDSRSIGRRLRTLGFKAERIGKDRTRTILVDLQLLNTLKLQWGLTFPENISIPCAKNVRNGQTSAPYSEAGGHFSEYGGHVDQKTSATVANLAQLQAYTADVLDISLQGGDAGLKTKADEGVPPTTEKNVRNGQTSAQVKHDFSVPPEKATQTTQPPYKPSPEQAIDYFLPDGTPVSCKNLFKRWHNLKQPILSLTSGKIIRNFEQWLQDNYDDVDLEDLTELISMMDKIESKITIDNSSVGKKPDQPCFNCGQQKWWMSQDGQWVCGICHPQPEAEHKELLTEKMPHRWEGGR